MCPVGYLKEILEANYLKLGSQMCRDNQVWLTSTYPFVQYSTVQYSIHDSNTATHHLTD